MEYVVLGVIFIIGLICGKLCNIQICKISSKEDIKIYTYKQMQLRESIVVLLTGILFIFIYKENGINITTLYIMMLSLTLIIISFVDIEHYIIPNEILIVGIFLSVVFNLSTQTLISSNNIIGGVICGSIMMLSIYCIEYILGKEVMGKGDIKLFSMVGFFLGLKLGLLTIILSMYIASLYGICIILYSYIKKRKYNSMIPYGPFISIAAIINALYGNNIVNWYFNLL